jgi:hypothetical protein
MLSGESATEAHKRMLFGNGRTHFSAFLKLPRTVVRQLPYDYAKANCVNADAALTTHKKSGNVPVMYAEVAVQ